MRISKSPEIRKDLAQDRGPVNPSKAVRPHLPKQGALLRMLGLNVDRALKVADAELPPGTVLNNTQHFTARTARTVESCFLPFARPGLARVVPGAHVGSLSAKKRADELLPMSSLKAWLSHARPTSRSMAPRRLRSDSGLVPRALRKLECWCVWLIGKPIQDNGLRYVSPCVRSSVRQPCTSQRNQTCYGLRAMVILRWVVR